MIIIILRFGCGWREMDMIPEFDIFLLKNGEYFVEVLLIFWTDWLDRFGNLVISDFWRVTFTLKF